MQFLLLFYFTGCSIIVIIILLAGDRIDDIPLGEKLLSIFLWPISAAVIVYRMITNKDKR